jgi:hypothetical protein
MHKGVKALLAGSAAVALTFSLGTASAFAATPDTTFTAVPGGVTAGAAGTTTLTDSSTGTVLTCTSSDTSVTLPASGVAHSGTDFGSITSLTFSSCTGPLGITFTVTSNNLPWDLNISSYDSSTGVSKGTITGINATLSGPSCSATVAGTTATTPGKVKGSYSNSTGKLTVSPNGGTLHIWNVDGCFNLIASGDASSFKGAYKVTPKQDIT